MLQQMQGGGGGGLGAKIKLSDTSETVHISSLALLKMLKHGRAGVPLEVMGLMLGEFTDEYTVRVVDVFAMPQSGTGVSVEAVDPVFQQKFMDMVKQTGRGESVVGWYHSHPGFGCWLSGVDVNTHKSFEQLDPRAVAVVVDPVQSVKGKVVIDAFRSINRQLMMMGKEPRQTTSNIGHLKKPNIQALVHGLNRHYYSLCIDYRKDELEEKMLMNLHTRKWSDGLKTQNNKTLTDKNGEVLEYMEVQANRYSTWVLEENSKTAEQLLVQNVGKVDPKRHLQMKAQKLIADNLVQCLGVMLGTVAF